VQAWKSDVKLTSSSSYIYNILCVIYSIIKNVSSEKHKWCSLQITGVTYRLGIDESATSKHLLVMGEDDKDYDDDDDDDEYDDDDYNYDEHVVEDSNEEEEDEDEEEVDDRELIEL